MSDDTNIAWLTLEESESVWDLVLNGKIVRMGYLDVNILIDAVDRGMQTCSFDINCLCHECGHHSACVYGNCSIACATGDDEYTPCHPTPTIKALDVCSVGPNFNNNPVQSVHVESQHEFMQYIRRLEHSIDESFTERHQDCEDDPGSCPWCRDSAYDVMEPSPMRGAA